MDADEPAGVRWARECGPGDAGVRVSLRRRLSGGGLGDVLGELLGWSAGVVRVLDRHGVEHRIAEDDVVAVRRVPPAPARRVR